MQEIILASVSKRRSQILSSCGIRHIVVPSNIKEVFDKDKSVAEIVEKNAVMKTEAVAKGSGAAIIIGADTLVMHEGVVMGKPEGEKEAKDMLEKFSGSGIEVYTGMCVMDVESGRRSLGVDRSEILVPPMDKSEIQGYFYLLGPHDKAGGFSIEGVGSMIFDNIKGSYFNILGLSMMKLKVLFAEAGLNILDFVDKNN